MLLLAAFIVVGLAVMAPMYAWELSTRRRGQSPRRLAGRHPVCGVVAAFLGFVCFNAGVAQVGPAVGSLFIHLMPVFASILSALVLGETPAWYHYAGWRWCSAASCSPPASLAPALAVSRPSAR